MYEKYIKRLLDIILSLIAIIITFPIFLIVGVLVLIFLGKPAIFKQERVGKKGKIFNIYKFRTMSNKKDENGCLLPEKERTGKFGSFLRKTSLDEIPEFINILKGDMSLIGPRPLLVKNLPYYNEQESHRHDVNPGLTGLAQVNGRNNLQWEERFKYDIQYINNINFINDIKILIMTVKKVLTKENIAISGTNKIIDFCNYRTKNNSRKIMIIGGGNNQLDLIKNANQEGLYTIVCDYNDKAIGKIYSNKFYKVSTKEKENLLEIAKLEKIDAIISNSEPIMKNISYIGNKLNLISNPLESIIILQDKFKFSNFLKTNNLNNRKVEQYLKYEQFEKDINKFKFPIIIKPAEQSGSRGVEKILNKNCKNIKEIFNKAKELSRNQLVLIEEFINLENGYLLEAEIIVKNGKIIFWGIFESYRNYNINGLVPAGYIYPARVGDTIIKIAKKEITHLVDALKLNSGEFNVELIVTSNGEAHIIELNPRQGGNMIPHQLELCTGINLNKELIKSTITKENKIIKNSKNIYQFTYVIHSEKKGRIIKLKIDKKIKKSIVEKNIKYRFLQKVDTFTCGSNGLGLLIMQFNTKKEMDYAINNINKLVKVIVV